ncbi:MAG: transposase [Pseudomonadota bacterium]
MTYPRSHTVDKDNPGTYLCTSRCVRRAWLCGDDPVSGQNFEHRRGWIEERLLWLASIFAIDLQAYAVMSNHYHCVVHVDPRRVDGWDDAEVARRWCQLRAAKNEADRRAKEQALVADKVRLHDVRERLGSLSQFMSDMNWRIACAANREDGVTGRFWQGRFDARPLLDEPANISGMVYVDLNPVRAGMTESLADAIHTSIARRIAHQDDASLGLAALSHFGLTLPEYITLLEWTAGLPATTTGPPAALKKLGHSASTWRTRVGIHTLNLRAYGSLETLRDYVARLGQHWIRGMKKIPQP